MTSPIRRSGLALTVLCTLAEKPMHAYRLQILMRERGKDRVVNIRQRASVYQVIERLLRAELIRVHETTRTQNRPERTVYELTDAGRRTAVEWIREMLVETDNDFPEFPVAVSHLMALEPTDAAEQLRIRASALEDTIAEFDNTMAQATAIPRLFLLDDEYERQLLEAQLNWTRTVIADLESGRLTWDEQWLYEVASTFNPPEEEEEEQ
ncbi:MAG TPA: PadR family transcriptional regulator [Stackebrandtia sp.]|jgi:DNA-binding PadR family transcriptional regulator|uniref:PadR family transcriptional regulator n=1 Tax=Stackebrandtia sp. TaxID=2023065 RepID=UPI002D2B447F|nr:PadR family transcriptional regulator [Stackebrandtia sp.]HZE38708.1 PadR family transcriptional regulator [Stackebrandtia sp.]